MTWQITNQFHTRKSSCVNARGIPPAVYWVILLLSYLGTPPRPDLAGGGIWPGYPPWQGTPLSWPGGYLDRVPPGRVPPGRVPPPGWTWQGTPPGVCPMAFWEMLQSIMGYGYPLPVDRQIDGWMEGQTRVKTLPSRRTTYASGKNTDFKQHNQMRHYIAKVSCNSWHSRTIWSIIYLEYCRSMAGPDVVVLKWKNYLTEQWKFG